jgi:hypothetical protein
VPRGPMLHGQVRVGFGYAAVMKLSAPKNVTWFVALAAGVLGVLLQYGIIHLAALRPYTFLLVAGGLALLLVASLAKGL